MVLQYIDSRYIAWYYTATRYNERRYSNNMDLQFKKYLPLTESTSYILLALAEPLHGYALMQKVGEMSQGTVKIGPGTLYGAFSQLEKEGLINMVKETNRRKSYVITSKGKAVLQEHIRRVEILVANSRLLV